ncbi:MAG: AmmeMemoRadiSam system radical SAM enzyme [Promethearchaeota archaeon]
MTKVVEKYFRVREQTGDLQCTLCPRHCVFKEEGGIGRCGARSREGNHLIARTYGLVSSATPDPVEKKPLYHFYPGSLTYSVSSHGCSLFCLHCQNFHISQTHDISFLRSMTPLEVVNASLKSNCPSISFTYNEPTIWIEYVFDVAQEARKHDLKLILVTNGYMNEESAKDIAERVHAANIDVKGFTLDFYRNICRGTLKPVLRTAEIFKKAGVHVEITNLMIPGLNDNPEETKSLVTWVKEKLGENTPLHFSAYYPTYKMQDPPRTPAKTILHARKIAKDLGLKYVYVGNIPSLEGNSTFCPSCGQMIIERRGFTLSQINLTKDNKCSNCNQEIPIIGEYTTKRGKWRLF